MSSNKTVRKKLEKLYGKECFIEKLHLRIDEEPRRYTSKGQMKRMKILTYHHIVERRNGGKTTIENGAILSAENHMWFNEQSPQNQRRMNEIFQEYKKSVDDGCDVVFVDSLDVPYKILAAEISVDERGKYNRAKKKQEDAQYYKEYLEEKEMEL